MDILSAHPDHTKVPDADILPAASPRGNARPRGWLRMSSGPWAKQMKKTGGPGSLTGQVGGTFTALIQTPRRPGGFW